ncbi:FtsQ-type POTRA domain-containing protein [Streptomyces sp. NBC_01775]|uniref:cell division protein FtsQ/DivIB n=1 Tax=Streptomyces sp. NBC_01775 TaxID=2975939 RepID=UPI002DDAB46D|nr:FtsQ-type POTRA domain-containing protein [Streptomyces sp. NBC_01775]WSB79750.1 FtsQ-type POTRA domain-containing protein [Streptomyces sp. NBC_01775]
MARGVKAARATEATDAAGPERTTGRGVRDSARPGTRTEPGDPPGGRDSRWTRLPRRLVVLLVLVLAALLGGFVTWALYGSPWLRVEQIGVQGNSVLHKKEIVRAAAVSKGAPLVTVDKAAVQRRVRSALPRVREVTAERSWPHGVVLTVTERRPHLVMESAGKYVEVDRRGVRFATVVKPPKGVPLLVLDRGSRAAHFSPARLRREAGRATEALPYSVRRDTRTVRVRSYDNITMELTGDREVRWGSAERGKAKAKSLSALMKAAKGAEHFDVSVPSAPAASDS